jgi:hypothetical protein
MKWGILEYFGFAVADLKLKPEEFYRLTYQEMWIMMLGLWKDIERKKAEVKDRTWIHADLKAHIANFSMYKRKDGQMWTADDFIKGAIDQKPPEKASLKKAKQLLGSKFNLN